MKLDEEYLAHCLSESGQDPAGALELVASRDDVRVLTFGENHVCLNPHRRLAASLLPGLAERGVRWLAVELPREYQEVLECFGRGDAGRDELTEHLRGAGASLFVHQVHADPPDRAVPCRHYFDLLTTARDCGLRLVAVDKDRGRGNELWYSRQYADTPRDEFMAQRIISCLESDSGGKLVFWGGSNHIYVRPQHLQSGYLTMGEALAAYLVSRGKHAYSAATVLPLVPGERSPHLSFQPLLALAADVPAPTLIPTRCHEGLSELVLGSERRCPWGSCEPGCPGVKLGICQAVAEMAHPVKLAYWDAVIVDSPGPRNAA
jgi:hypothetical protein